VIVSAVGAISSPQINELYCTADFNTCFIHNRGEPWHVADRCAAGQSPRLLSVGLLGVRCHSIDVRGLPAPLHLGSAACAKQMSE
jgi:hypothetical protein